MISGEELSEFLNSLKCCEALKSQHCACSSLTESGEGKDMHSAGKGTQRERKPSSGSSSVFKVAAAKQNP